MKLFNNNEPFSAILHIAGLFLSIVALVILVVSSTKISDQQHIIGFSIFGTSLVLLYLTSALYHLFPKETHIKRLFQKFDHSMIFVLIAGTYTPICLTIPNRNLGWSLFGIILGLTIIGISLKLLDKIVNDWVSMSIYLSMSWLIVVLITSMIKWIPIEGVIWLLVGGIFYTLGCVFYKLDKHTKDWHWIGFHDVFHIFVLLGSFCHFWLMYKYILYT